MGAPPIPPSGEIPLHPRWVEGKELIKDVFRKSGFFHGGSAPIPPSGEIPLHPIGLGIRS